MTRLRSALLILVVLNATACTPAMLSALGIATAAAPAVVSVLDAYAATARAIAPAASQPDLAVLADLLRKRDECTVAASVVLMPDAGAPVDATVKALEDSATATRELVDLVRALTAVVDAGTEGGR